jgi:periplasmic glucans biosynthesis protein
MIKSYVCFFRSAGIAAAACILLCFLAGRGISAETIDFTVLAQRARDLAQAPYKPRSELDLPKMEYEQFHNILFRPDRAVWKNEKLPFQLQFFPVGWIHKKGVTVYEVVNGEVRPMPIDTEMFSHAKDKHGKEIELPNAVSGFRLHAQLRPDGKMDEFLVFMGASYFRALANGMGYGISARGISLNTAHPDGEEFPDFTTFWIVRPSPGDPSITLYALLDGPSCTGAYRLTAATGDATSVTVKASIFMRKAVKQLGIAPLTSMFWYGENSYPRPQDYRPEVHDSDGLLIAEQNGDWIWRPLLLSPAIRHCTFQTGSPKGFGLLMRDRTFDHYQDLGAHNETRPSLWVEPVGQWDAGRVHLVELPTHNEYMDNIIAFWEPEQQAAAGARFDLEYRLTWLRDAPQLSPLGRVTATRRTSICKKKEHEMYTSSYEPYNIDDVQEFIVDYSAIKGIPCDERFKPDIKFENSPGAELVKSFIVANPETGGWRVFAHLKFKEKSRAVDLSLKLVQAGKAVSEKWTYLWQP